MKGEAVALDYVRTRLRLENARELRSQLPGPPGTRPDLVVETDDETYVVEVKAGRADLQAVGQLCFYRDFLARSAGFSPDRVRIVLAAKNIPASVREALETVGGTAVDLPANLAMSQPTERGPTNRTQITTPQAWQVAYTVLAQGPSSVRRLSMKAGVSYGWTHRTVRSLEALGIVERRSGQVVVADIAKLLNGVAWERPFGSLRTSELATGFASVEQGARELTRILGDGGVDFAFTAHTAAGLYTGYGFRADRFYLYLADPSVLRGLLGEGGGPRLEVYRPDRELADHKALEDIRVASQGQVLLDLAGMGPAAGDMTDAMVKRLA